MKTLYLTGNSANIWVDAENGETGSLDQIDRYDIRNTYLIEEPMHVVYQCGETREELDVKKGDILCTFYARDAFKNKLGVIKSKEWKANVEAYRKAEQKAKEEWAKKHAEDELTAIPCCGDCDLCENCAKCEAA
jgi:hypothetical protein